MKVPFEISVDILSGSHLSKLKKIYVHMYIETLMIKILLCLTNITIQIY